MKAAQRSILVTGCSSGIGLTAARMLRERGYRVLATARRREDVDRLLGEGLEALPLDLDDDASIRAAVAEAMERTGGRIYGLFNNGAYGQPGAVEDLTRQVLRAQLETNLLGWHELTRLVLPAMRRNGEGRIVNNSSVLGLVAFAYRGAYVCSKFALEGLTDTLRLELRGTGIHVSLIEPGPVLTRFRENALRQWEVNVDVASSPHRARYEAMRARLAKEGPTQPFTLPPEAVVRPLLRALESRRPKARYYVTVPTHLFAILRRLLPTPALDAILAAASGGGRR
ncbi:MAG: SDR family oxidoreductase [Gammaproteobacteria bacterium]|jgi:NAD(P)-dependent dehydrogenase (short-subunit alcohol dehydrogenase family)|nr:SDR family oxidoreductase [Gammaproteobacteria bacterium]